MNKKLIFKLGFSALLTAVMLVGFTATSDAQLTIAPAGCPTACPTNLSGYSHIGYCTNNLGHGCVEECQLWRNNSSGAKCSANCAWQ